MDGVDPTRTASPVAGDADDAAAADAALQAALGSIGSWRDLDWEEMIEALARIRHESEPTPPIKL